MPRSFLVRTSSFRRQQIATESAAVGRITPDETKLSAVEYHDESWATFTSNLPIDFTTRSSDKEKTNTPRLTVATNDSRSTAARVSESAEDLSHCVPLDLHLYQSSGVGDDVAMVTQLPEQPAAPCLVVCSAEECPTDVGGSPDSGVPSIDESSSSSDCDGDQTFALTELSAGGDYLAPPTPAAALLVDGRYRRRRNARSSSITSSASSSSISPPPAASGTTSRAKYACDECDRRYATSSNLSRHKQTHRSVNGEHARPCPHCRKVYVSMPALSMHLLTHDLKYRCSSCDKAFSRPWLLRGHERSHTGEKPFACSLCGKAFADRSNLRAHVQTHSGAKRFRCSRCLKTFALKSYLTTVSAPSHLCQLEF